MKSLSLVVATLCHRVATFTLVMAGSVGLSAHANASDTDWKLYGASTMDHGPDLCFFDLKGVVQASDKHIRVWTKCLHQKDTDGIDIKMDYGGKILENAARKMVDMYIPPIALVENIDSDEAVNFTKLEEIADTADIQPAARIFYEIDCSQKMLRELSIEIIDPSGKIGSKYNASEWKYVAPETNGARLQKILCEKSVLR